MPVQQCPITTAVSHTTRDVPALRVAIAAVDQLQSWEQLMTASAVRTIRRFQDDGKRDWAAAKVGAAAHRV